MIGYYDDDTHFCLKCHSTILGLDNYVSHRKAGCSKNLEENPKSPLPSQLLPPGRLQSSSKKTPGQSTSGKNFSGILTRSKATAVFQSNSSVVKDANEIQQSKSGKNVWIGGDQLKELGYGDNQTKLIKAVDDLERRKEEPARLQVYEESEEDSEEYDYDDESSDEDQDVPPRHFTGGKWKPSSPIQWSRDSRDWNVPPPSFTGGKWKPSTKRSLSPPVIQTKGAKWKPYSNQKEECDVPPPTFTGSKWVSKKQYEQDAPTTATRDRWKPRTDIDEDVPPPNHTKGKWKPKYQMEEEIEKAKAKWKPRGELEGDYPPPTHTKGKWKPKNDAEDDVPSPSYTKGKWKPKNDTEDDVPSPGYTKGKWKPKTDAEEDVPSPGYTKGKWKPKNDAEGDVPDLTKSKWKRNDTEDDVPSPSDSTGKWKPKCFGEDDVPPPGHTKGKWKPRNETEEDYPPPSHTKGKWKPKNDEEVDSPQPSTSKLKVTMKLNPVKETKKASLTRTAGSKEKWLPSSQSKSILKMSGESPLRKSDGSIQYWCNPCSRSLASKVVYERHLKSELHFKRTLHDREFDDHDDLNARRTKIKPPEPIFSNQDKKVATTVKKRNRKKVYIRCDVCHSKVGKYLIGKHLISHYHCRKGDITTAVAREMVLENIYGVVLECPFQCSVCRFYCNTHDDFLRHWLSEEHVSNNAPGYFFCSLCKFRSEDTELMYTHLVSQEHNEVVSVINRSVPIVIKKINPIHCLTCNKEFTLNMQLLNHCRKFNHDDTVVRNFINEYICQSCGTGFLSNVALQRHRQNIHKDKYFVCTPCNLRFDNSKEAKLHRRSLEHKYFSLSKSEQGKGSMSRKCEYCQESFANFLLLKQHLKTKHPEHKIRCPHCGTAFTITQELTLHLRSKSCKLEENPENAYRCEKCLFSSNSTSELFFHLALHDEPLLSYLDDNNGEGTSKSKPVHKYKCPLCDRFFPKSSLQAHIRVHTQERPFVCKICNAKFARKNNLQFHVKNHDKKGAKKIVKEVSGERPFLCLTCGASFRKK
ncbi:hypothetical protein NQ315_005125 [Exocentrus adspersus]|uniref:C2H2-type domain-containing protein n=1 Tax=Exocentrus adspersus TaxID=1586481 RepID=A0AAV8VTS1_9CUCU|nr:hypothetical protein NQ315_005125 [Exocentrus adspersus]